MAGVPEAACITEPQRRFTPFASALRELQQRFDAHLTNEEYQIAMMVIYEQHQAFVDLNESRNRRLRAWRIDLLHILSRHHYEARSALGRLHGDAVSDFQLFGEPKALGIAFATLPRQESNEARINLYRIAADVNPSAVRRFDREEAMRVLNSGSPALALAFIDDHRAMGQSFVTTQRELLRFGSNPNLSETRRAGIAERMRSELDALRLLADLYEDVGDEQAVADLRYDVSRIEKLRRDADL